METECGDYRVVVMNAGWGTDLANYRIVYQPQELQDKRYPASSWHTVTVFDQIGERKTCLLTAGGGASGVHANSAVCLADRCYVAVGDSVCVLRVPELDLLWHSKVDQATCFGVYHVPEYDCLISHGEVTVARIDWPGKIMWQTCGADILTEGFVIRRLTPEVIREIQAHCPDFITEGFVLRGCIIEATDWNKTTYYIDIETGRTVAELPPAQGA